MNRRSPVRRPVRLGPALICPKRSRARSMAGRCSGSCSTCATIPARDLWGLGLSGGPCAG